MNVAVVSGVKCAELKYLISLVTSVVENIAVYKASTIVVVQSKLVNITYQNC